ncbi:MAG: hypothetical protein V4463_04700 [Pseudomonadota bacterium]
MNQPAWTIYEDAARRVVSDLRNELDISVVEGKQVLVGKSSAEWEIDAKAWCTDGENFLVIEARRHTSSGQKQEALAAIAYRIQDVGANGGIVISPLPLQTGARAVAAFEGIAEITLAPDSTCESYLAEFMGRRYLGASVIERVYASDTCDAVVIRSSSSST